MEREVDLDILEHIKTSISEVRQRDLAFIVGKSLGMTNAILKRLTERGLLAVRKVNNRNISYIVTPHGLKALAGRSYRYFKRTIKNVVYYKDAIELEVRSFLKEGSPQGGPEDLKLVHLVLVGASDLDFIVEHLASKHGLGFLRQAGVEELKEHLKKEASRRDFVFWGEEMQSSPSAEAGLVISTKRFLDLHELIERVHSVSAE